MTSIQRDALPRIESQCTVPHRPGFEPVLGPTSLSHKFREFIYVGHINSVARARIVRSDGIFLYFKNLYHLATLLQFKSDLAQIPCNCQGPFIDC